MWPSRTYFQLAAMTLSVLSGIAGTTPVAAQEAAEFFRRNCASCHTIGGGRLTGPDLKGVLERRERDKLVSFIVDPKAAVDSGDPYVRRIVEEARGVIMQPIPGVDR